MEGGEGHPHHQDQGRWLQGCMYEKKTSTVHSQRCSRTYAHFLLLIFTLALGCDVIRILFLLYSVSGLLNILSKISWLYRISLVLSLCKPCSHIKPT